MAFTIPSQPAFGVEAICIWTIDGSVFGNDRRVDTDNDAGGDEATISKCKTWFRNFVKLSQR